jgi:hypothetical protein
MDNDLLCNAVDVLSYFTRTDFNSSFCFTAFTTSMPLVTCPKTV